MLTGHVNYKKSEKSNIKVEKHIEDEQVLDNFALYLCYKIICNILPSQTKKKTVQLSRRPPLKPDEAAQRRLRLP